MMYNNTVLSATVVHENDVLLQKTRDGLSLFGGLVDYMDCTVGFPGCLVQAARCQGIELMPEYLLGIYQHKTENGLWVTNINVAASLKKIVNGSKVQVVSLDEIAELQNKVRTPDTIQSIQDSQSHEKISLDFVTITYAHQKSHDSVDSALGSPEERTVAGMVIHSDCDRYLLLRCARGGEHSVGKLSLPGGKVENEHLGEAVDREVSEEVGFKLIPAGIIGIFINGYGINQYATSIITYAQVREKDIKIIRREDNNPEIIENLWFSWAEIQKIPLSKFRTPDTFLAIQRLQQLARSRRKPVPLSIVKDL